MVPFAPASRGLAARKASVMPETLSRPSPGSKPMTQLRPPRGRGCPPRPDQGAAFGTAHQPVATVQRIAPRAAGEEVAAIPFLADASSAGLRFLMTAPSCGVPYCFCNAVS